MMNSAEKETVLHCLKSMIDEEVCEECPLYGTTGTDHCEKDCVRLAINALEQEPCEDTVSRREVFETFGELLGVWGTQALMELPSVTPQPKTGHWIKDEITERSKAAYKHKCDLCGAYHRAMYDYCPSCGAKMQ